VRVLWTMFLWIEARASYYGDSAQIASLLSLNIRKGISVFAAFDGVLKADQYLSRRFGGWAPSRPSSCQVRFRVTSSTPRQANASQQHRLRSRRSPSALGK
jgi:hypothetical protein